MARREDFDNSLWSDPDFLALSADARLVYIWTWTNPRCGMAGLYKVAPSQAAFETGLPEDRVMAAFTELAEGRFAFYEQNVLWVRTRVKHLRQKTKQIATAIGNDLRRVSDSNPLKGQFLATYSTHVWLTEAISGEGRVSLDNPSPEPIHPRDGHPTVLGTGGGNGGGAGGFRKTRARTATRQTYTPDPAMVAMRDAYFPGVEVGTIESAAFTLRRRRVEVTPEAIRQLVGPETEGNAA